jgi:hypothetical protein
MSKSRRRAIILGVLATAAAGPAWAQSPQWTDWGSVRELEAGWSQDTVAVYHSAAIKNPDGCAVTNAGYATNPADPGHSLFHTVLLSAFMNRKEVHILLSGCVFDKPRIIAVGTR